MSASSRLSDSAAGARLLGRDAELVVEVFAVGDAGQAVGVRLVLGVGEIGPQAFDLLRRFRHLGLDPPRMRQHVAGRVDDLADQRLHIGRGLGVVELAAQGLQAVAVGGGAPGHAADQGEQLGHRGLDPLAGLVEQPDLAAGAEEPLVQLGQAGLGERLALLLDLAQALAQFGVAARAVAIPDPIVVRARRDLPLGHRRERGGGQCPRLFDRLEMHPTALKWQIHHWCRGRGLKAP